MAKILIHSDSASSATSVSNIFIDEYMSDANGEFVKIYLYLLRLMNAPDSAFSISSIAVHSFLLNLLYCNIQK